MVIPVAAPRQAQALTSTRVVPGPLRILCVALARGSQQSLVQLLHAGFGADIDTIEIAPTVVQAIARLNETLFTVLFCSTDAHICTDLLTHLAQIGSDTPVLVVADEKHEGDAIAAVSHGAADYLIGSRATAQSLRIAVGAALKLRGKDRLLERARRELAAHEKRFRTLLDYSHALTLLLTPEGIITYASSSIRSVLGLAPQDVLGRRVATLLQPDDAERLEKVLRFGASVTDIPISGEYRFITPNGDTRHIEALAINHLDDPSVNALVLTCNDVTERRSIKHALDLSDARLRAVVDAAPVGIIALDLQGRVQTWNTAAEHIFGWTADEVIGRHDPLAKNGEQSEYRERLELVRSGQIMTFECERQRKDYWRVQVSISAAPLVSADGQTLGVMSIITDISARKRIEQQKARADAALLASEERYRTLFERTPTGVYCATLDGSFLDCNDALASMLGYASRADAISGPPLTRYFSRDTRDKMLRALKREGRVLNLEHQASRKDGAPLWVLSNASTITSEYGEQLVLGSIVDVTERHLLEDQLRQAQKLEAIGRLAGGVAHDFNNLLMVISGYAELMEETGTDSQRKYAAEILRATRRAAGLTRHLLAFSRKQVLAPRTIDVRETVQDLAKMLRRLIGEDVELSISQLSPDPVLVRVDPLYFEQVVINLVTNARDAMPSGGKLSISVLNEWLSRPCRHAQVEIPAGRYGVIAVGDTGTGMDSNTLTRIFEPFFTTKDATKGTGLGLATVYGFVKQSGGYITVDSKLGRGTTFRIFLPLTESPVLAIKAPEPEHAPVAGRETILVVEDEVALREAIAHLLRERGYHVLEAASGQEALAIVSTFVNQIDVLLTDVVMPAMSGPEVARAITAVRPCIKTLFMSGHAEPTLRQYCAPGEVSLLQKPFTSDVLGRAIAALLRGESAAAEQADAGPTRIGPREASTSPPQDERANNAS